MVMDPGSDVEDSADDIVRQTDKGQEVKAIYSSSGPRRGNPSPACLLDYGVSTDYNAAAGFGMLSLSDFVPSQVPPPSLL